MDTKISSTMFHNELYKMFGLLFNSINSFMIANINECEEGTSNCLPDHCVNTKGSFRCDGMT